MSAGLLNSACCLLIPLTAVVDIGRFLIAKVCLCSGKSISCFDMAKYHCTCMQSCAALLQLNLIIET